MGNFVVVVTAMIVTKNGASGCVFASLVIIASRAWCGKHEAFDKLKLNYSEFL